MFRTDTTHMCVICARPITKNMVNKGLSYILAKLLNLSEYQAKLQDVLRTRWSNCTSVSSIRMLIQLILISICQIQPHYPVLSIVTFEWATALQYINELFVRVNQPNEVIEENSQKASTSCLSTGQSTMRAGWPLKGNYMEILGKEI